MTGQCVNRHFVRLQINRDNTGDGLSSEARLIQCLAGVGDQFFRRGIALTTNAQRQNRRMEDQVRCPVCYTLVCNPDPVLDVTIRKHRPGFPYPSGIARFNRQRHGITRQQCGGNSLCLSGIGNAPSLGRGVQRQPKTGVACCGDRGRTRQSFRDGERQIVCPVVSTQ